MGKGLTDNLNSAYVEAANRLAGKQAPKKIVAYVESYDDVLFWSNLLREAQLPGIQFEVILPSRYSLSKGKKIALANDLGPRLGKYMIACVDADYDYVLQGVTENSKMVCTNPYVFHTYAYAIENFQCYAPTLHNVCVMATLNDRNVFDLERFLSEYSEIVWPLFVWNVWAYRYGAYKQFSLLDFARVVTLTEVNLHHPDQTLARLRHLVNGKISRLQKSYPQGRRTYKPLWNELLALGLTPQTTYMYMRGHDLFDGVVTPLLSAVCDVLRKEREREIRRLAEHATQLQNELSAYAHASSPIDEMLRKNLAYTDCPLYQKIIDDIKAFVTGGA